MNDVTRFSSILLMAGVLGHIAAPALATENRPLADFFGVFVGTAETSNIGDESEIGSVRDLDVEISGYRGSGFILDATTVLRSEAGRAVPGVRRRHQLVTFEQGDSDTQYRPVEKSSVFSTKKKLNAMAGDDVIWARRHRDSLTAFLFAIDEEGRPNILSYERRLVPGGMVVDFERRRDGEKVRDIVGRMVRANNENLDPE